MDSFILNMQSPIGLVQVVGITDIPEDQTLPEYNAVMNGYMAKGMSLTKAFNRFAGCLITFDAPPAEATKLQVTTGELEFDTMAFVIRGAEEASSVQFVNRGLSVTVEQLDEIVGYTDCIESLLPESGFVEQRDLQAVAGVDLADPEAESWTAYSGVEAAVPTEDGVEHE